MKCPVCQNQMAEKDLSRTKVYFCENGCKGILLSWKELIKLSKDNEQLAGMLDEALNSPRQNETARKPLACPACNIKMHQHIFDSTMINVDECYSCGSFFLDSGELPAIRKRYSDRKNKELEKEYKNKLIENYSVVKDMQNDLEWSELRNNAIKSLSSFLMTPPAQAGSMLKPQAPSIPGTDYSPEEDYESVNKMTDSQFKNYLKEVRHSRRTKIIAAAVTTLALVLLKIFFILYQVGYFGR